MSYKEKCLEIKNQLNQSGGMFVIPDKLKPLVQVKDDGTLDISNSIESFLGRWKGITKKNQDRRTFLNRCIVEIPGVSTNIIDVKGNGTCFYECVFMFLSMTNIDFPFTNHEEFKNCIIRGIEDDLELREQYGDIFNELLNMIKDPNCPDLEIPISKICFLFDIKLCSINLTLKANDLEGYVRKYNMDDLDDKDCITILVSEGHVLLIYPTDKLGSNRDLRIHFFNTIDEKVTLN
jgi:hypothetical protein